MKGSDKVLIGIVAGIVVLVIVALLVAFLQPKPSYMPEGTPTATAHNYLLALQQADYARAYGYLSPTLAYYPATAEEFQRDVSTDGWPTSSLQAGETAVAVGSVRVTGDQATVTVEESTFSGGGILGSGQSDSEFTMLLQFENGAWKLVHSDQFWSWCWENSGGCR